MLGRSDRDFRNRLMVHKERGNKCSGERTAKGEKREGVDRSGIKILTYQGL